MILKRQGRKKGGEEETEKGETTTKSEK